MSAISDSLDFYGMAAQSKESSSLPPSFSPLVSETFAQVNESLSRQVVLTQKDNPKYLEYFRLLKSKPYPEDELATELDKAQLNYFKLFEKLMNATDKADLALEFDKLGLHLEFAPHIKDFNTIKQVKKIGSLYDALIDIYFALKKSPDTVPPDSFSHLLATTRQMISDPKIQTLSNEELRNYLNSDSSETIFNMLDLQIQTENWDLDREALTDPEETIENDPEPLSSPSRPSFFNLKNLFLAGSLVFLWLSGQAPAISAENQFPGTSNAVSASVLPNFVLVNPPTVLHRTRVFMGQEEDFEEPKTQTEEVFDSRSTALVVPTPPIPALLRSIEAYNSTTTEEPKTSENTTSWMGTIAKVVAIPAIAAGFLFSRRRSEES